jgi:hypothetical protein
MPANFQCQACSRITQAPTTWDHYTGPWRCEFCQARHIVTCSYGSLTGLRLEDRFTAGEIAFLDGVAADVREALAAYNAYAPRAAVVMIRRALERACREKGGRGNKLWLMIKDLHERAGLFDEVHISLATATRQFGNFGAHPNDDLLEDLTDDEARRALDLGIYLLKKMLLP